MSGWIAASGVISDRPRWPPRRAAPGTPAWAGRRLARSSPAPWPTWSRSALDTPRLAGAAAASALASVIFAGTAADVSDVVIGGRDVVRDGQHLLVPDVPAALAAAIRPLLA